MSASAGGAALSGLASIAATKILAVTLGPAAVAALQTLQQVRQSGVVLATANGGTALVQGASALHGAARGNYVRTVASVFLGGMLVVALSLRLAPAWLFERTGLASVDGLVWLVAAIVLTSVYVFLTGLLNSLGRVETLAALQIAGPGAMALLAFPFALAGSSSIASLIAISALVSAAAAFGAILPHRRTLEDWFRQGRGWLDGDAARHFFSISTAMLVTGFAASAAVVLVRGNIVRLQGLEHAGLFDAAWSISMNQVMLVLASVQTYYLPSLSRARTPEEKAGEISRVLIAATLVAAPVIAGLALFKPLVIQTFYSSAFSDASRYLRWTLVGDFLKVSSWILSIPMLAAADMKIFMASDLVVSAAFVSASSLLLAWREPAESAAIAFAVMYAVHLGVSLIYVYFRQGIRLSTRALLVWVSGMALVTVATLAGWNR